MPGYVTSRRQLCLSLHCLARQPACVAQQAANFACSHVPDANRAGFELLVSAAGVILGHWAHANLFDSSNAWVVAARASLICCVPAYALAPGNVYAAHPRLSLDWRAHQRRFPAVISRLPDSPAAVRRCVTAWDLDCEGLRSLMQAADALQAGTQYIQPTYVGNTVALPHGEVCRPMWPSAGCHTVSHWQNASPEGQHSEHSMLKAWLIRGLWA